MNVLVTGATGALGRHLCAGPTPPGAALRAQSRRGMQRGTLGVDHWVQADLAAGTGLDEMLRDVHTIVHAATDPRHAAWVDGEGTTRLLAAAARANVQHVIYVSILGVDRIPFAYYRHKVAAERAVSASVVPHSIVRVAQFHTFIDMLLASAARCPLVMPMPGRFFAQSVACEDVAARLWRSVADGPVGRCAAFAGPEIMRLEDMTDLWKSSRVVRKPTVRLPVPGAFGAAMRAGFNTMPSAERGSVSWQHWLTQTATLTG